MTTAELKASLKVSRPPENISPLLKALWYDAKGEWTHAHTLAQEVNTKDGSWVHAYLHRKEGDKANAQYWYSRAGKNFPRISLADEWDEIVCELISTNQ
ncbi:MAG: hypothetical protein JST69_07375 [Bacteroidetes bacterium]|nr:hypothetical protein [Bacteroidota bacterium]